MEFQRVFFEYVGTSHGKPANGDTMELFMDYTGLLASMLTISYNGYWGNAHPFMLYSL